VETLAIDNVNFSPDGSDLPMRLTISCAGEIAFSVGNHQVDAQRLCEVSEDNAVSMWKTTFNGTNCSTKAKADIHMYSGCSEGVSKHQVQMSPIEPPACCNDVVLQPRTGTSDTLKSIRAVPMFGSTLLTNGTLVSQEEDGSISFSLSEDSSDRETLKLRVKQTLDSLQIGAGASRSEKNDVIHEETLQTKQMPDESACALQESVSPLSTLAFTECNQQRSLCAIDGQDDNTAHDEKGNARQVALDLNVGMPSWNSHTWPGLKDTQKFDYMELNTWATPGQV